jgi:hypothetical protein
MARRGFDRFDVEAQPLDCADDEGSQRELVAQRRMGLRSGAAVNGFAVAIDRVAQRLDPVLGGTDLG